MVNKDEVQIQQVQEFISIEKELDDLFEGIDQEREKNLKPY